MAECAGQCTGECGGTCWQQCGNSCSGKCDGGCSGTCKDSCGNLTSSGGSCINCGKDCQGCGGGCTGTAKTDDGGSGGGCTCASDCAGACKDACDTGCYSDLAFELYNKLKAGLNRKILAADLQNINDMIQLEATRRSKSTTSQTFSIKHKANSSQITALKNNLTTIGYSSNAQTGSKDKAMRTTGQELIDKALAAYEETISH